MCKLTVMYRVFLGAPSIAEIDANPASYSWRTTSSHTLSSKSMQRLQSTQSVVLPPATLEAASRRISLIYKDIVFEDDNEEMMPSLHDNSENEVEISVFRGIEQTTTISWPPSIDISARDKDDTQGSLAAPSFLLDTSSTSSANNKGKDKNTGAESQFAETQALESQSFGNFSDASSVGRFPSFHFNMHMLSSLSQLTTGKVTGSTKINVLLAVLEVEGPDTLRIKKGPDAGQEVSILKLILGDDEGNVVKLTAWREVAEDWGGTGRGVTTKRGDVVHIENVTAIVNATTATTLSASPHLKSRLVICYRTMPYTHEDGRLRPDLRLGISEPNVRKVSTVVAWFERMAGLAV